MPRPGHALSSLAAVAAMMVCFAARADTPPAVAATPSAPAPADATATAATPGTPVLQIAPTTPAPAYQRPRTVSNNIAAALASGMPKYNPPPKPSPDDEDVDLRDLDKPKNHIVRLPKYTVTDKKPPVFTNRQLYTNKGLADLLRRRYLSPTYSLLNSLYIPLFSQSPTDHAMAMYREDERLDNMSDLKDTAGTLNRADAGTGTYVKKLSDDTYMRHDDFRNESGPQVLTGGSRY